MGGARVRKSFDRDIMERLHDDDLSSDPVSKAKSVTPTTDAGLARAEAACRRLFEAGNRAARFAFLPTGATAAPTSTVTVRMAGPQAAGPQPAA